MFQFTKLETYEHMSHFKNATIFICHEMKRWLISISWLFHLYSSLFCFKLKFSVPRKNHRLVAGRPWTWKWLGLTRTQTPVKTCSFMVVHKHVCTCIFLNKDVSMKFSDARLWQITTRYNVISFCVTWHLFCYMSVSIQMSLDFFSKMMISQNLSWRVKNWSFLSQKFWQAGSKSRDN